ncbi:MAG: hypothetical protein IJ428_05865 [Clostridia bacterium]|nr:hypothetical protein [Clostridia bacterium]
MLPLICMCIIRQYVLVWVILNPAAGHYILLPYSTVRRVIQRLPHAFEVNCALHKIASFVTVCYRCII